MMFDRRLFNILNAEKFGICHETGLLLSETVKRWEVSADSIIRCFSDGSVCWGIYGGLPAVDFLENLRRLLGIYTAGTEMGGDYPFAAFSKVNKVSAGSMRHMRKQNEITRFLSAPKRETIDFLKGGKPAVTASRIIPENILPQSTGRAGFRPRQSVGGDRTPPDPVSESFFSGYLPARQTETHAVPKLEELVFKREMTDFLKNKKLKKLPPSRPHASLPKAMQQWKEGVSEASPLKSGWFNLINEPLHGAETPDVLIPLIDMHGEGRHLPKKYPAVFSRKDFLSGRMKAVSNEDLPKTALFKANRLKNEMQTESRQTIEKAASHQAIENKKELVEKIIEVQHKKPFPQKDHLSKKSSLFKQNRQSPIFSKTTDTGLPEEPSQTQNLRDQKKESSLSLFLREWESERLGNKHSSYNHPDIFSQEDTAFPPSSVGKGTDLRKQDAYQKTPDFRFLRNNADKITKSDLISHGRKAETVKSCRSLRAENGQTDAKKLLLEKLVDVYWTKSETQSIRDEKADSLGTEGRQAVTGHLIPKKTEHLVFERNSIHETKNPARKRRIEDESPDALSRKIEEALKEQARRYGIDL